MTDKTKPISGSNPPESKGKKLDQVQESVKGVKRVVKAENDDNEVATLPESTGGTNTVTKTYTTKRTK